MVINICGDLFPTTCNMDAFASGDIHALFGQELVEMFFKADINICNLEGALTNSNNRIDKSGPAIKAAPETIEGYKRLGIHAASLANNHIGDYGDEGIKETIKVLCGADIDYFGAGMDEASCRKSTIIERDGVRIGFYSCAEYEFTIVGENRAGANPYDELHIYDDIQKLRYETDYVIVLYHGSKELFRYPVPYVRSRCRRMVENGANLVLCQHSHCIGTFEKYRGSEILYGQGDFLFNRVDNEYRHSGLVVVVEKTTDWKVSYVPVVINGIGVSLAKGDEKKEIMNGFLSRSKRSEDTDYVKQEYLKFAMANSYLYYNDLLGKKAFLSKVLTKLGYKGLSRKMYSKKNLLNLLNDFRCEAHRDLFITALLADIERKGQSK